MRTGTACHDAMEQYLLVEPKDRTHELLDFNVGLSFQSQKDEAEEGGLFFDDKTIKAWATARNNGRSMVERYWNEFGKDEGLWGGHVEYPIRTHVGTYTANGEEYTVDFEARVDYVIGNETHDFKTTSARPWPSLMNYTYFTPQFRQQGWLLWKTTGIIPTTVATVLWPTGADRDDRELTLEELERTGRDIARAAEGIVEAKENGAHPREGYQCRNCFAYNTCVTRMAGGSLPEGVRIA